MHLTHRTQENLHGRLSHALQARAEQLLVFPPGTWTLERELYQNLETPEAGAQYKFGPINSESQNGNRNQACFLRICFFLNYMVESVGLKLKAITSQR